MRPDDLAGGDCLRAASRARPPRRCPHRCWRKSGHCRPGRSAAWRSVPATAIVLATGGLPGRPTLIVSRGALADLTEAELDTAIVPRARPLAAGPLAGVARAVRRALARSATTRWRCGRFASTASRWKSGAMPWRSPAATRIRLARVLLKIYQSTDHRDVAARGALRKRVDVLLDGGPQDAALPRPRWRAAAVMLAGVAMDRLKGVLQLLRRSRPACCSDCACCIVGVPILFPETRQGPVAVASLDEVRPRVGFAPIVPAYRPAILGDRPDQHCGAAQPGAATVRSIVWREGEQYLVGDPAAGGAEARSSAARSARSPTCPIPRGGWRGRGVT